MEWVINEEPQEVKEVSRNADGCGSAQKVSPLADITPIDSDFITIVDAATKLGAAETSCLGYVAAESRENNGNFDEDAVDSPTDDAVDKTMSEAEVETLLLEDEIQEPKWPGNRRLVIKDTFHSYVRPVWQPKLTTFCTSLTGISQVR